MTFLEAAHMILVEACQPLHYREITKRALEQGIIQTRGNTPEATMNAQLGADINHGDEGGPLSRFVRVGKGTFGLRDWSQMEATRDVAAQEAERSYLTYRQAAIHVLTKSAKPLSAQTINERAIEEELINPQGLTPDATMAAQLYTDISRKGAASLFRKEGRNLFGLAEWEKGVSGIARLAGRQRQEVKRQLHDLLMTMLPGDFEALIGRLLATMGYDNVAVTRRSADGGIDVVADIEMGILQLRTAVQVKRMKGNVQRPVVSQLRGDMALLDVDQGMIITTGGFSRGAKDVARIRNVTPITLIDGDRLADLLIECEIGVRRDSVEVVTLDEESLLGGEVA